jgi:hypothetical protein
MGVGAVFDSGLGLAGSEGGRWVRGRRGSVVHEQTKGDTYIKKVQPGTVYVDEQIIRPFLEDWVGCVERQWYLGMVGVLGYHKCFHDAKSGQHSGSE